MTREAEVREALGARLSPRGVSWPAFAGLVLMGLGGLFGLVGTLSYATARSSVATPAAVQVNEAELSRALNAYQAQKWDEAERLFRALRERHPEHVRVQDYLDRIELTRRDAERLARAEEALVAGQYERARMAASEVAPNSALFAQAESLSRSARHHAAPTEAAGRTNPSFLNSEVRVALGEALALYADGQYAEAAERAEGLARKAHGATRHELAAWAQGVRDFARGWLALPGDDQGLLAELGNVRELIDLDQRLGEGAYARALRQRVSEALERRAADQFARGALVDACASHQQAGSFRVHERAAPGIEQRCEGEAQRRLGQARALAQKRPEAARELYDQVRSMVAPTSSVYRAASQALDSRAPRLTPAR